MEKLKITDTAIIIGRYFNNFLCYAHKAKEMYFLFNLLPFYLTNLMTVAGAENCGSNIFSNMISSDLSTLEAVVLPTVYQKHLSFIKNKELAQTLIFFLTRT